jgi:DNA polymerase-3 subunit alpha
MSPEELLREAKSKGIKTLALTDISNTSGVLDFFRLAPKYDINPVTGIEFRTPLSKGEGQGVRFIGIAKNLNGFYELNKFLSRHLNSEESFPSQAPEFESAFIIYPFQELNFKLRGNEFIGIHPRDLFHLQTTNCQLPSDKLVALTPVTFRNKKDFNAHRLLRAIDNNTLLSKLSPHDQAQPDEIMLSETELKNVYKEFPQIIFTTKKLLEQCEIDFEFGKNKNKKYFSGSAKKDYHQLMGLCYEGLNYRYPNADEKIIERFEKEVDMIVGLGFSSYFLINQDIVRYAQHKKISYVGRGSGANSMVAYLLRITDVDPIDLDLYFERFINPSRKNPPDFDIDFSSDQRDEIIKYIFQKHGTDHTALLATYSTFKDSAVVRELGKVFGLPKSEIDSMADEVKNIQSLDNTHQLIYRYAQHLYKFPNHLSIHAGGVLISDKPIYNYTATTLPPKNFPLVQFSMIEAEDIGLYKFDILAQRGLGKIRDAAGIIKQNRNTEIDIHDVQKFKEDEKVRDNLQHGSLMGCFYVESPAMRMLLTKLEAKEYPDLVAASSIIRPGVASSGMMREYVLRFKKQPPSYETPKPIYDILHDTFGVMVYQEDVIKVAHYYAGLTLEEADVLRRGMSGKYRGRDEFQKVEQKFFDNCKAKGYDEKVTKEVWRQIESFAGYAFSKGHSASYAVESYQCMYLKTHFPLEYMVAVINNGGGFYGIEFYVHEARMCGANIHAPDINTSELLTCIYGQDIYLGLNLISELEKNTIATILNERNRNGNFLSLEDFSNRVSVSLEQIILLIRVNAFRFTGRTKQQLLWDIHMLLGCNRKSEVRHDLFPTPTRKYSLPELYYNKIDDAWDEMELLGFPLCSPFELNSPLTPLQRRGELLSAASEFSTHLGNVISIIGYMVTRKSTRTKRGDAMAFGTFLDKEGKWIDTTHFPNVLAQFPFYGRACYLITGKVVEEFGFYSLEVTKMQKLNYVERFSAEGK